MIVVLGSVVPCTWFNKFYVDIMHLSMPEGGRGGGGADVGHLTFCEIFFSNSPPLVKIDQISPPKISAHFFW